jgi:hypothetical protein
MKRAGGSVFLEAEPERGQRYGVCTLRMTMQVFPPDARDVWNVRFDLGLVFHGYGELCIFGGSWNCS